MTTTVIQQFVVGLTGMGTGTKVAYVALGNAQCWGVNKNIKHFIDRILDITGAYSYDAVVGSRVRVRFGEDFRINELGHITDDVWLSLDEELLQ